MRYVGFLILFWLLAFDTEYSSHFIHPQTSFFPLLNTFWAVAFWLTSVQL